ncbi:DUF788 domain-containing protein [Methanobacterium alkalithermotolerans]|uniref:DUF788 domain-containing protein n=1 Tax=Methanobacterium alkalithermotolerans TaxID=2731220 RepID=A0A8T8K237_9EURY|nr:DUF788 domain-containing protein [Methanobacterium alkalithermotolerans]QUH22546.1 DUF788 domain-containing protein [Methanobacterium alkalithermotolerans]RJS49471.1 MAG: DUF788 domain-containing protein [Methanobacterium sp.]
MTTLKVSSYAIFLLSISGIIYALVFNPADWIVYAISIVLIPTFILSLGLILMAQVKKEEEDERRNEPFIGY